MRMLDRWNETQGDVFKLLETRETITLLIVGCRCLTNALPQFHAMKREVENKGGHTSDHKRQLQFSTCKEAFCCQNPGAIGC